MVKQMTSGVGIPITTGEFNCRRIGPDEPETLPSRNGQECRMGSDRAHQRPEEVYVAFQRCAQGLRNRRTGGALAAGKADIVPFWSSPPGSKPAGSKPPGPKPAWTARAPA